MMGATSFPGDAFRRLESWLEQQRQSGLDVAERLIFLTALGVSASFVFLVMGIDHGQESDGRMYLGLARDPLMFITGWSDSRQPLLPLLLAGLHLLFGESAFLPVARLVMCFLPAVNSVLVFRLAGRLAGRRTAVMAGAAAALYPNLFFWSAFLMTETLAITLILTALLLLLRVGEQPSAGRAAVAGLSMGITLLGRASLQFFLPFALLWLAVRLWRQWRALAGCGLVFLVVVAAVVAPWTIRNYVVLGRFVPIALNGGSGLYGGNNPLSLERIPGVNLGHWDSEASRTLEPACWELVPADREACLREKAVEWIVATVLERPRDFLRLEYWKLREAWFPRILDRESRSKQLFAASFVLVSLLALAGMLVAATTWRRFLLLYCLVAAHTVQTLVFFGDMRNRASYEPALLIFGALAVDWTWKRLGRKG